MTNILTELPYLPPVSWMAMIWEKQELCLEACENFQKGSYRNRCYIAGPNGIQRLSIPLLWGKHQQTPVREVRIAYNEPWQQVHWRSIQAAYGNAPFYPFYADELVRFYENRYVFLFDLNLDLLYFLLKKMGWPGKIQLTEGYTPKGGATQFFDFRDGVTPKNLLSPAWFQPEPYPQVFTERHGFLPGLSALDLLFCCGRQSGNILQKSISTSYI